jgi:hypothetical protein
MPDANREPVCTCQDRQQCGELYSAGAAVSIDECLQQTSRWDRQLTLVGWRPSYIARERTPKKTTVPSIVALLSNGCKQAFPVLTVDLQHARHNTK